MKIAIFTDLFLEVSGGIPSSISAQKASLEKSGHQVVIFCPGRPQNPPQDRNLFIIPTCKHFRPGGAPWGKKAKTIQRWIERNCNWLQEVDIIHVHYEGNVSIAGAKLAKKLKKPLVQTMHGREDMAVAMNIPFPFRTPVSTILNWLHSRVIPHSIKIHRDHYLAPTVARAKMWTLMVNHANFADLVLTPSAHFKEKLTHYGVQKPIKVLSNGVSDDLAQSGKIHQFSELGSPLNIIWNSRVSREKRFMEFLNAVKLAQIPIRLDVFGTGNELAKAKHYVKINQLSQKVIFHGQTSLPDIIAAMHHAHLGAIMSYGFDTQGLTLLEAQVVGLPVIFCDPDMRQIVPENGAILTRDETVKSIVDALEELYAKPERIEKMSRAMLADRQKALQSTQTKKLIDIYQSLMP